MPELPEVETVRQSLEKKVNGLRIEKANVITPSVARGGELGDFAEVVTGKKFLRFDRRGKYLIAHLEEGLSLVVHLRMTGRWVYCGSELEIPKHTHVIFTLSDGNELRFTDTRRFGGMEVVPTASLSAYPSLVKLGVEPLESDFTPEYLGEAIKGKKVKIKSLILDQTRLAGLGNIYADEALFLAGIHPERLAGSLNGEEIIKLHGAIREVLKAGIANKGTTFRDYVDAEGQQGTNQLSLKVYGRSGQHCLNCGVPLGRIQVGGRTSVFCPNCQA
ncbi:MAG TPA: bifunctional DNA-formamidopyrimidine glycosylase/DNA-(apurinic or apyrimidinic site) lyase [Verrucomicrobiae bacterium]|nr:bifunctional DNA-formamidopyrimidine glycosylase/DNA-(apurinic or apyrimidinic site) lyase [Verrucomicrobiae bacterium]